MKILCNKLTNSLHFIYWVLVIYKDWVVTQGLKLLYVKFSDILTEITHSQ